MKRYIPQLFVVVIVGYLLFLIRPAIFGKLGGTFQPHQVPQSYVQLEEFLNKQNSFSRTLWVPTVQRFGFYSYQHPAVSAEDFFHVASVSGVLDMLGDQNSQKLLQDAGIRYVIVPYDSEREIFLKDRKYNDNLYQSAVTDVRHIFWLKQTSNLGKIVIFEVQNQKDHFWLDGEGDVAYQFIDPTKYKVNVRNVKKGEMLVFSESFDKYWQMKLDNRVIASEQYEKMFNSFILPTGGSYAFIIFYKPQEWVQIGLVISASTLILLSIFGLIIWLRKLKRGRIPA